MADFDAIIIGTVQAGPSLAFRLAGAGRITVTVYRHYGDSLQDCERTAITISALR